MGAPTYQETILTLERYWADQGCVLLQPYHTEVGAGTFNPATFLRSPRPRPVEDGVRGALDPAVGRALRGEPVPVPALLPVPGRSEAGARGRPRPLLRLARGRSGSTLKKHDVRLVEDDWEGPTLGAWGLGWEVWIDGMEVTQFTYFQQLGGLELDLIPAEITYGLERLAMFLQGKRSAFDLVWAPGVTWGDVYRENERQWSIYNFEEAPVDILTRRFDEHEAECRHLLERGLPMPAYDQVLKCSHTFNLLDARGAISVTERAGYIGRVRALARRVAQVYLEQRHPPLEHAAA